MDSRETDKMAVRALLAVAFSSVALTAVTGLDCYNCSGPNGDSNWTCLEDPSALNVANCSSGQICHTIRVEDALTDEIIELSRGCSSNSSSNATLYDVYRNVHMSFCDDSSFCNDGDGSPTWFVEKRIKCYSCDAWNENSTCVTNPDELLKTSCMPQDEYCEIKRMDINGEFSYLERNCSRSPSVINVTETTVIAGQVVSDHFTACEGDFCNAGDGVVDAYDKDKFLWCYSCTSYKENSACVLDPESDSTFLYACPPAYYCTIERREVSGEFSSLHRDCNEHPQYINKTIVSGYQYTHYTACRSSLCNSGDGVVDPFIRDEPYKPWSMPAYAIVLIVGGGCLLGGLLFYWCRYT